jgi:hypothetical protein
VLDGFQSESGLIGYDHVGDIQAVQWDSTVTGGERGLVLELDVGLGEFVAEAFVVDGFENAGTESAVHAHRQADDAVGEIGAGAVVIWLALLLASLPSPTSLAFPPPTSHFPRIQNS